ncbi:NAD(P)-binding protein [Phaeosphaeriaceae sp. SRC1lsM3a]|nr:NAD(P)-binding protein [Stagonospora sp. SRC1lsM3a]
MATTKSVLVTGCSDGGLGSALALTFAQRGLLVFATARSTAKMTKLANLPNVRLLTLDITKPEDVSAAVASVKKETGGSLDFLINNAGQARYMPMLDESPDVGPAKDLFELNVWSQLRMVQEFAPLLMEAKGTAVYTSSIYGAAKRATEIMFDALRLELRPFGVSVVTVVTGPVSSKVHTHTDMWKLPENSLYAEAEDMITKRAQGDDGAPRMDTMKYASGVVDKLLKGGNPKFWAGGNVGIIKLMWRLLPESVIDWMMFMGSGLDTMMKNKK